MDKMEAVLNWLAGTNHEFEKLGPSIGVGRITIRVDSKRLTEQQVEVIYNISDVNGEVEYEGDPAGDGGFDIEKEMIEDLERSDDALDKIALHSHFYKRGAEFVGHKRIIVDLADPNCFDTLNAIIEEGAEANVQWKYFKPDCSY